MERIEAVIFDWGGVLIDDPAPELMRRCAEALGVEVSEYVQAHAKHSEAFQKGEVSEEMFWLRVCNELNRPAAGVASVWGEAFYAIHAPREAVFALIGRLRDAGVKVAILSNAEAPAIEMSHEPRYGVFDAIVLSCLLGTAKPEREIYETAAARLQVHPQRCVFIDDKQAFVDGAVAVGMKAILYQDLAQVEKALKGLGVPVRGER